MGYAQTSAAQAGPARPLNRAGFAERLAGISQVLSMTSAGPRLHTAVAYSA